MPDDQLVRPSKEEVLARLKRVKSGIRITKITCTRSIKSRNGDSFCGFSASWQSVQEDYGGPGSDTHADGHEDVNYASQGLKLSDARLARLLLAMECDLAALESAMANGGISLEQFKASTRTVRSNYYQLIQREMGLTPDENVNEQ